MIKNMDFASIMEAVQHQYHNSVSGPKECHVNPDRYWVSVQPKQNLQELDLTGWKLHLQIKTEDLPQAWDIVWPIIEPHAIKAKFERLDHANLGIEEQPDACKTIVIYDEGTSPKKWQNILQDIETGLNNAKIMPGKPIEAEPKITGSRFAYYRNELDENDDYVPKSDPRGYNPSNRPEIFDKITITQQPKPPTLGKRERGVGLPIVPPKPL